MPSFPIPWSGFLAGSLVASAAFFLLFLLLQYFASFGQGTLPGAIAEWMESLGPLLPWVLAFGASVLGTIAALAVAR